MNCCINQSPNVCQYRLCQIAVHTRNSNTNSSTLASSPFGHIFILWFLFGWVLPTFNNWTIYCPSSTSQIWTCLGRPSPAKNGDWQDFEPPALLPKPSIFHIHWSTLNRRGCWVPALPRKCYGSPALAVISFLFVYFLHKQGPWIRNCIPLKCY